MAICHSFEHLDDKITRIGLRIRLLFTDSIKEITSTHQFHDEEVTVLLVKEINERDDVRVVKRSKNGDFIIDSSIIGRGQILAKNTLDGNLFPCCPMCSTANSSKGS